jgi:hypothetical protein
MTSAIFESTGQALHVSFLIMSLPAKQEGALRKALIQIIESIELPTKRQAEWLDQLRGVSSGTVNFGGLSAYEVRAQCAMVTQTVRDHLPGPEKHAVLGRYSIQVDRAAAVMKLGAYIRPQLTIGDETAIHALLYGCFAPHMRDKGLSLKDISDARGIHVKTLKRAAVTISNTVKVLEGMAIDRLTPMFERDGLIPLESRNRRFA